MAIINVLLTDTFDTWRQKTNTLGTNQGDLANLDSSFAATDLVSALNEIKAGDDLTQLKLGDSTGLAVNRIRLGDSDDLQLYHDGTDSIINATNLKIQNAGTTRLQVTSGGATITGDLAVTGDNIILTTNTAGHIMVADGTHYVPVAMSGDVTIAASGATTISNDAVTNAMIATDAVNADSIAADAVGSSEIAAGAVGASEIADGSITSTEFNNVVTLIIYDSAGSAVKTLRTPGS